MLKQLALAGILGLSLTTLANAPLYAQDIDDNPLEQLSDEEVMTPVRQVGYPIASPGSIHLYHWTDYARNQTRQGSVNDLRFERERRRDKMYQEVRATYWDKMTDAQKMKEDELYAEPVSFDYTRASPGSIHMHHWMGINRQEWMPGSVNDMKYMQQQEKDKMWWSDMKQTPLTEEEEEMMREPVQAEYPRMSPGSLHLWHWQDYRREAWMPGSVNDHRMDRDRKMREKWDMENKAMNRR